MTKQTRNSKIESGEIDLVELVKALWNKKWGIVLFTSIFSLLAGVYAFTAKEQWTSKAEIIEPRIGDLGNYLSLRKEYARILGDDFDLNTLIKGLYGKFENLAYSLDERKEFLSNSLFYKQASEGKDDKIKIKLLNDFAHENIHIIKPDVKKDPDAIGRKYTFSAETAILAQDSLKGYVNYLNGKAFELELSEFLLSANEKLRDLKFEYENIKVNLDIQKNIQLENLNKALDTAIKAGIKGYSNVLDVNSNPIMSHLAVSDTKIPLSESKLSDGVYIFMLGEKYLKAQIDSITQKEVVYPPRYYQIAEQLKELSSLLNKASEIKANAFSYLSSPDYPVRKDKPKQLIIVLLGFFIGMLLSIGFFTFKFVFLRNETDN